MIYMIAKKAIKIGCSKNCKKRMKSRHLLLATCHLPLATLKLIISILVCISILWTCAYKVAPSGGPEDKTPPEIRYTFPAPDSTNIDTLPYIEFRFSEAVDKSSINNQIWLLPELPHGYELKWKGSKTLRIILNDTLEKDQTYIFTIGTGVRDMHRNSLKSPFTLPFSTGAEIDHGEIQGKLFDKKPQGIFLYAYQLSDTFSAHTVFDRKPHYYIQADNSGDYRLKYLNEAGYRVYALEDVNGDRKYTMQTDRIGIPFEDVTIDSQHVQYQDINFFLIREDTTRPELRRVDALNNRTVEITFSEPLNPHQAFKVEIQDSVDHTELPVIASALKIDEANKLQVYTRKQNDIKYRGSLAAVQDTAGNFSAGDSIEFYFAGVAEPDTTQSRLISIQPSDNSRTVNYDAAIRLTFSDPVDSSSLKNAAQLFAVDSLDTLPVNGKWHFQSLPQPGFMPDTLLKKNQSYQIQINLSELKNIFGEAFTDSLDSLYISHFTTKDWAQLGEISGVVYASKPAYENAIILASPVRGTGTYTAASPIGSPYLLEFLPEGLYLLKAGIDINKNGILDKGSSLPFRFSEPVIALPDTVKVRKRWTTDGIDFRFQP